MSFQNATATALPAEVQLAKEKPQGAFCLRTRYALSANSANSWSPGALCSLPLQTGTPGTFTDVKQGNINCTLQISNTNPYVDYLNFGPCGAMIFFEEMRVYSSGTPVEENLRYSETVDLLMEQGGWQCRPLHVFRRNKWRANNGRAGDKHINFIKPAMVDAFGCPMFGRTPFMDKNSAVYQPPSIALGYQSSATGVQNLALQAPSKASAANTFSLGSLVGQDSGYTFNDDALFPATAARVSTNFYADGTDGQGFQTTIVAGRNSTCVKKAGAGDGLAALNDMAAWKNTQVGRTNADGAFSNTYPWLPCASFVPSQWPDYQPCTLAGEVDDFEVDNIIGKTKVAEYMKYLANVRSLPIGVPGNNSGAEGSYVNNCPVLAPASSLVTNGPACRFLEYRVSMPFLSGIYGILADKMFPDLLIGANNIRIEFKLALANKALWLTMDPLRRVPGTVRDFTPFTGAVHGSSRGGTILQGMSWPTTGALNAGNAAATALGCFNARVVPYDSGYDATLTGYNGVNEYDTSTPATAQGNQAGAVAGDGYLIVRNSNMYNTASAMGEDLVPTQQQGVVDGVTATIVNSTSIQIAGGHFNPFSSLPKPQYVPSSSPWTTKDFFTGANVAVAAAHCNERVACYGTYLPASTPQVRRCQISSRLGVSDSFNSSGSTTYYIRDLQYIGEQVQLDDLSASSIIQMAASSEVVVWSRGYRSFEADCTAGEQQNLILPIQIGQATALYLVFRPGNQMQSFDHYSNSFVCPFTGVSFAAGAGLRKSSADATTNRADVGGVYLIKSSLDTQNQGLFSYQLFSGTKQYPLQPIQTVSEMLVEREKSTHSLHNWSWTGTENMNLMQWDKPFTSSNTQGLSFDPFLDLGFFTAYVPTLALDDQTITQNPYFSIAEVNEQGTAQTRLRGIRQAPAINSTASAFTGVLNQFVPPVGTFFLGWDFESWTNHDDLMRTGKFLGQEQLTVRMTGTYLMTAEAPNSVGGSVTSQSIRCTAIVPHIVKLSFVPGGHMLTYY